MKAVQIVAFSLVSILLIVQTQNSFGQGFQLQQAPEEVEQRLGGVIDSFESDLNLFSSLSPENDPRQFVDEDGYSQGSDYSVDAAIGGLKKIANIFSPSASPQNPFGSMPTGEFGSGGVFEAFEDLDRKIMYGMNVNFGLVLGVLNTIAILVLIIVIKIKWPKNKDAVEQPKTLFNSEMINEDVRLQAFSCPDNNKKTVHRKIIKDGKVVMVHLCNKHKNHPAFRHAVKN